MTEWNASGYYRQSALQQRLAEKCLAGLELDGTERLLDVGCGDGKITAAIAARLSGGSIVGVDPSTQMIDFARQHFQPDAGNLRFEVGDAAHLGFRDELDLVVSFNALHWVTDQAAALSSIRRALRPSGRAVLQLVCKGELRSLEAVIEDTCAAPAWASCFVGHCPPFLHLLPDEYRELAERCGLSVDAIEARLESWDFGSRRAFVEFAHVTFVEWTRSIPPTRCDEFIADALDRYLQMRRGRTAGLFEFYQMRALLRRA